jgi:low affinity Fe/Cu permease
VISVIIWVASGPIFHWSDTCQLVINTTSSIVTLLMVFLIQATQNRDTLAIQAKLDELIRASSEARNGFIGIDQLSDVQLRRLRAKEKHS